MVRKQFIMQWILTAFIAASDMGVLNGLTFELGAIQQHSGQLDSEAGCFYKTGANSD